MSSFLKMPVNRLIKGSKKSMEIAVATFVGVSAHIRDSIVARLTDINYRTAYIESNIAHGIAHQIRINRELRGWSQDELAKKCGSATKQATISRLEDPAYGNYSLRTLLKLASAFDVALIVKFVPYSKFLIETFDKSPAGLFAKSFSDENLYLRQATMTLTMIGEPYFHVKNQVLEANNTLELFDKIAPSLRQTFIQPAFINSITKPTECGYKNV